MGKGARQQHILDVAWNVIAATPGDNGDYRHSCDNNTPHIKWSIVLCPDLLPY